MNLPKYRKPNALWSHMQKQILSTEKLKLEKGFPETVDLRKEREVGRSANVSELER